MRSSARPSKPLFPHCDAHFRDPPTPTRAAAAIFLANICARRSPSNSDLVEGGLADRASAEKIHGCARTAGFTDV